MSWRCQPAQSTSARCSSGRAACSRSAAASSGSAEFVLALAAGPHQQVIRPAELEEPALTRDLQREALFGDHAILDPGEGTSVGVRGERLVLEQQSASLLIDQVGSIRIIQPLGKRDRARSELPAILEEDLTDRYAEPAVLGLAPGPRGSAASTHGRRRRVWLGRRVLDGLANTRGARTKSERRDDGTWRW